MIFITLANCYIGKIDLWLENKFLSNDEDHNYLRQDRIIVQHRAALPTHTRNVIHYLENSYNAQFITIEFKEFIKGLINRVRIS